MAVLMETKLTSHTKFQHALAHDVVHAYCRKWRLKARVQEKNVLFTPPTLLNISLQPPLPTTSRINAMAATWVYLVPPRATKEGKGWGLAPFSHLQVIGYYHTVR